MQEQWEDQQVLEVQPTASATENNGQYYPNEFQSCNVYKGSKKLVAWCLKKLKNVIASPQSKETRKKFLIKLIIFGIIFAIIVTPIYKKAAYRRGLFSAEIIDKVNVDYDDYTANIVLKFNIINDSRHNANRLEGYITISDAEGTVLAYGGTWFSGAISAKNSTYHELSFDLNRSAATTRLWNADLSELIIKYRITEIHFDDGTVKEYIGKDVIVNKP